MPRVPLTLPLQGIIVIYLKQDAFTRIDSQAVNRHSQFAGLIFGLLGGVLFGAAKRRLAAITSLRRNALAGAAGDDANSQFMFSCRPYYADVARSAGHFFNRVCPQARTSSPR